MEDRLENQSGLPIPDVFLSTETNKPIERCINCEHDLSIGDRYYVIEKVFKRYPVMNKLEVLFEYAICQHCYDDMKDKMSKESAENLSAYMMNNTDFVGLHQRINQHPDDPEAWLDQCMIKGTPQSELSEFQMGAFFKGDRLVTDFLPPFMVGNEAMEEMNALLSKETKDEMDDFMGDHFGIPPELRKDLVLI
jgi:hypothetical protein